MPKSPRVTPEPAESTPPRRRSNTQIEQIEQEQGEVQALRTPDTKKKQQERESTGPMPVGINFDHTTGRKRK